MATHLLKPCVRSRYNLWSRVDVGIAHGARGRRPCGPALLPGWTPYTQIIKGVIIRRQKEGKRCLAWVRAWSRWPWGAGALSGALNQGEDF